MCRSCRRSFAAVAATGEVGILVHGTGKLREASPANAPRTARGKANIRAAAITDLGGVIDVTIKDLALLLPHCLPSLLSDRLST
jgi:hypothetical protein